MVPIACACVNVPSKIWDSTYILGLVLFKVLPTLLSFMLSTCVLNPGTLSVHNRPHVQVQSTDTFTASAYARVDANAYKRYQAAFLFAAWV